MRALVAAAVLAVAILVFWLGGRGGSGRATPEVAPEAPVPPPEAPEEPAGEAQEVPVDAEPPDEPRGEPWEIRVVDEEGSPIPGASIDVYRRDELRSRARTDGAGFATPRLERSDDVVVHAPGFTRRSERSLLGRLSTIVLREGYRIAGVVVDAEGNAIVGVAVRLGESDMPPLEAVTGSSGEFALEGMGPGLHSLRVEVEGLRPVGADMVASGDEDVRIVLHRPAALEGIVVFPDGSPAPGAKVSGKVTDAEGRFRFEDQTPGPFDLRACFRTSEKLWSARVVAHVGGPPVRVVLGEPTLRSCVRARVLDRNGAPVAGAGVQAGRVVHAVEAVTDATGRALCELDDPPGTPVVVEVSDGPEDGLLPARAEARTSSPPGGEEVVLRPREPAPVTVVVQGPAGAPLPPGVRATIRSFPGVVLSEADDRVVVAADPTQQMFVHVKASGYAERLVRSEVPSDGVLEVVLEPLATIRCRLVDASGAPVTKGAFVGTFVPPAAAASAGEADGQGVFVVQRVAPGRVQVTAGLRSRPACARAEVLVEPGAALDIGTLVLGEPRALAGRVTATDGRPLGGVKVIAQGTGGVEAETWSHGDGSFRLRLSPWFAGRILARKPGYGAAHAPPVENFHIVLPPEGRVRLSVRLPLRPCGWSLDVRDPVTGFRWELDGWIQEEPDYVLEGLPPGRLVLIVDADPPPVGEVEVVVRAGETVPATIVVPE